MIKAVIYDLDGMLFREPYFFTEELAKKYDIPLSESGFSKDPRYLECKRGKITLNEFLLPYYNSWQKHASFTLSLDELKKEWFNFTKLQADILNIAKQLKLQGIKNFIITNNSQERLEYLTQKYGLADFFEIISSYNLHVLKPDPKFFNILKERYDLTPEEVLYFDDKSDTVESLQACGFKAIVYHSIENFKTALKNENIAITQ